MANFQSEVMRRLATCWRNLGPMSRVAVGSPRGGIALWRFYDAAQFVEDDFLVVPVTATVDQPGRTADVAVVLVGPLNNLYVSRTVFHFSDSWIASCTARTW